MDFEPKWLAWEITRRCNLNCVHCRSSSDLEAAGHPDFSLAEAKRVLDDIKSYASPVVVLSGGEPLLRDDLFDIARHGTGLGLRMCIATNGSLVTAELASALAAASSASSVRRSNTALPCTTTASRMFACGTPAATCMLRNRAAVSMRGLTRSAS